MRRPKFIGLYYIIREKEKGKHLFLSFFQKNAKKLLNYILSASQNIIIFFANKLL